MTRSKEELLEECLEIFVEFLSEDSDSYSYVEDVFTCKKFREDSLRSIVNFLYRKSFSVPWYFISIYQELSEEFMRDFQDILVWDEVSEYQYMSEEFIIEFINEINVHCLKDNEKIPKEVKQRIMDLKKVINS